MPNSPERDPGERYVCTADDPWTPEKGTPAIHPDAVKLYTSECERDTRFECPNCNIRFWKEGADA